MSGHGIGDQKYLKAYIEDYCVLQATQHPALYSHSSSYSRNICNMIVSLHSQYYWEDVRKQYVCQEVRFSPQEAPDS